jgi:addiction module RelE/StbE family toxin
VKRELIRTNAFIRAARRYVKKHAHSTAALEASLTLLEQDAFDPRLKTHKLKGDLDGCWACSAGYNLRIIFNFVEQDGHEAISLLALGSHDEVY